jgi:hypothetical protein
MRKAVIWQYFQPFVRNHPKVLEWRGFFDLPMCHSACPDVPIRGADMNRLFTPPATQPEAPCPRSTWPRRLAVKEAESAYKPGSVRLAARQSFLSAWRHRQAPATYPGTTRAALSFPYSVLLQVGFTVPCGVSPARGALLPHPFTLTTHTRGCRSAVCSLLHWPSARAAQALPGTLPYGARTFLDALARDATVRPTPSHIVEEQRPQRA